MKVFLSVLIPILLFSATLSKVYYEKEEDIEKRLKYLNDNSKEKTKGKIIFKHTNETGVYCEATKDIPSHEYTFYLTNDDTINISNF